MGQKYYAVKEGRIPGIYATWEECKAQVTAYSGAVYKKFESLEEAQRFIGLEVEDKLEDLPQDEIIAYVDGSFNSETQSFGYGLVLIDSQGFEKTFKGSMSHPEYSSHRNVAGEVFASMMAIDEAIKAGKNKIHIHFDYMGIEAWARGTWKTNKELTKKYKSFVDEKKSQIKINFIKVKAHSNDKYNDMADKLAKEACGILEA